MIIPPFISLLVAASLFNITPEEAVIARFFPDAPEARIVAMCESNLIHSTKDGILKNHQGSSATGLFQIMDSIHGHTAKRLGLDIYTLEGNAQYARYLYDKHGWKPWLASNDCHLALK